MGDEICLEQRLQELYGMMWHVNLLRHQRQQLRHVVTKDLWGLYLILRQPHIHHQWPRAAFRGVAAFLDPDVDEVHGWAEDSSLETLRVFFNEVLTKSTQPAGTRWPSGGP